MVSPERSTAEAERYELCASDLAAEYDVPVAVVWVLMGFAWLCAVVAVGLHYVVRLFMRRRPRLRVVAEGES